jgi:hypothetical protein
VLLLAHYLIVVKLDLNPGFLVAFSALFPIFVGFILSRQGEHSLSTAFLVGVITGVLSVSGMLVVVGFVDTTAIIPSSRFEWREAVEYAVLITLGTVLGSALARILNWLHLSKRRISR